MHNNNMDSVITIDGFINGMIEMPSIDPTAMD